MAALPFARRTTGSGTAPRTAFVLSGGGNQGVAQVGMLRALAERGIVPDVVVGTSAGAINGAAVAANPTPEGIDVLAEVWRSLHGDQIFPGGRLARAWNVVRKGTHLFSSDGLRAVVEMLPARQFSELAVPLRVVTCDFETGEEVVLASGPLTPAILASAALPGVFPPVEHGGRLYIDGGVVNNVPLRHALMGPVQRIFVLNVTGGVNDAPPRTPLDVTLRAFAIARNRRYELERHAAPGDVEILEFPRPDDGRAIFDFSGGDTIIDEAYAMAGQFLDALDADGRLGTTADVSSIDSGSARRWFRRSKAATSEVA